MSSSDEESTEDADYSQTTSAETYDSENNDARTDGSNKPAVGYLS